MQPTIGLFIPCYVNQFYPQVGVATLKLLQQAGCKVEYPLEQTCCGQPMANAGYRSLTTPVNELFIRLFEKYDYIVAPSGSCVLHLKEQLHILNNSMSHRLFEICEFMTDILKTDRLESSFPYKVALHPGCHGQRGLHLSHPSEIPGTGFDKPRYLLEMVKGIELVEPVRPDECCGFGGTFSVSEEAVSVKMGQDRIRDFVSQKAEYITSTDMSCLMHLEGILRRQGSEMKVRHVAEILAGR
jgi:L-lactate dehydrogenase complex protein LldE